MSPSILHVPSGYGTSAQHYLIFFITGNPGLIEYYTAFLSTLHRLLESRPDTSKNAFHVYGRNFDGFADNDGNADQHLIAKGPHQPFSLSDQINLTFAAVHAQRISTGPRKGENFDGVILIGHSVGSFVLLEVLQRARLAPSAIPNIIAGFLLFPTVVDIAKSPSGVKATSLLQIPNAVSRASTLVGWLMWALPWSVVKGLVKIVTKMPNDAATVTTRFLKSRNGVWQALYMAEDEMTSMTEDRWDEDIWGVEHPDPDSNIEVPKLVFYWGQNDHWVADSTRDALIKARGQRETDKHPLTRPKMIIDQDGIPHSFCINHSELVAEKVKTWIDDIIEIDPLAT